MQELNKAIYKKKYPDLPASFFDEMFEKSPLLDERSNYTLVFEGVGLSKAAGMIRFAAPDPVTGLTPSEKLFDVAIARDPSKAGLWPRGAPYALGNGIWGDELNQSPPDAPYEDEYGWSQIGSQPYPGVLGEFYLTLFELKNLVTEDGLEDDLLPLMYFSSERGWTSNHIWDCKPDDIGPGKKPALRPYAYVLFCDERMVPYYRDKMHFRLLQDGPVKGRNYAFILTREEYLDRVFSVLKKRPGFGFLKDSYWSHTLAKEFMRMTLEGRFEEMESPSFEVMFGRHCDFMSLVIEAGRKK
jgi:hypothetical protein